MIAIARHLRISPKKANLVAELVRRKPVNEALDILKFTPKKAAPLLAKVIKSAAANAEHNFKQNPENLIVKEIVVTKGMTMKRSVPISRGRMHPILKVSAHIRVSVAADETPAKETKKATPKKAEAKPKAATKKEAPKAKKETAEKAETKSESKA